MMACKGMDRIYRAVSLILATERRQQCGEVVLICRTEAPGSPAFVDVLRVHPAVSVPHTKPQSNPIGITKPILLPMESKLVNASGRNT